MNKVAEEAIRATLSGPRPRVLIVDDDQALLEVMCDVFASSDYDVKSASSARLALELLDGGPFDVVFCDVVMPGMDGLDFLHSVRTRDLDLPVVMLTGNPNLRSAVSALEDGALQYLVKPVNRATLMAVAHRAVGLSRLARVKRMALEHLGLDEMLLGDRAGLESGFARALTGIYPVFQPILQPSGAIYGYEALMRSEDHLLSDPGALLDAGERLGRQADLSRALRDAVLLAWPKLEAPPGASLFVNAQSDDIDDAWTAPLVASGTPIVLEVTERAALRSIPDLQARVRRLRASGVRIAIDDLGAGYAGLTNFAALEPDIVKLDMALVRDADREPVKRRLIASLTGVCRDLGVLVVAEGIEREGERDAVLELGCNLLQGFLLGRPRTASGAASQGSGS